MTTTNYRADHVGSLLRPPELLQARDDFSHGRISQEQLKEVEDGAILAALEMQRQVGIDVLTDGEYRRHDWVGDFTSSVDGYVSSEPPIRFEWKLPEPVKASGDDQLVVRLCRGAGFTARLRLAQLDADVDADVERRQHVDDFAHTENTVVARARLGVDDEQRAASTRHV